MKTLPDLDTEEPPEAIDLDFLADSWALFLRSENRSPRTVTTYRVGVRAFKRWCERTATVPTLCRSTVQQYSLDMIESDLEPATVLIRVHALRYFSAWLFKEGELERDELVGIKGPKLDTKVVQPYSLDELGRLLAACEGRRFLDYRDEALVRFLAETGGRASETVGMLLSEVRPLEGTAKLYGKGARERTVPFGPKTATAINRYIRARRPHRLAGTDQLWLGAGGKTFGYKGLYWALSARARAAEVPGFHPHRFRHTMADRWLEAGGSELGLMSVGGWSGLAMVQRYSRGRQASRAIEESRRLNLGDL